MYLTNNDFQFGSTYTRSKRKNHELTYSGNLPPAFHYRLNQLNSYAYQGVGKTNHQESLSLFEHAIELFEGKEYSTAILLKILYYQKLICHLQLKQFGAALETAEKCEELLVKGTFNWFKIQEVRFQIYKQSNNGKEASKCFRSVVDHANFNDLPNNIKETWINS
jgi:tetratricopeptide (TPR) repeat protein